MHQHLASSLVVTASLTASLTAATTAHAQPPVVLTGYVESYYQWNFNTPSNHLTNARGFDNRHNSFTLSNVTLDAAYDHDDLLGRLALQVGSAPSTYYLAEPLSPGSPSVSSSGPELWKYVREAYGGYRFAVAGRPIAVTAGLFLSPIGPESLAVRDNWNWSRSNLFFGLPFYHVGLRAQSPLSDHLQLTVAVTNGWNNVVDNNEAKSAWVQLLYTAPTHTASLLAFTGAERPDGAPEGRALRHLLDAHLTWHVTPAVSLLAHADAGLEPNNLGTSRWLAGALAARVALCGDHLFASARADAFAEHVPDGAAPIFWPVAWVASGTATLEARPHERASFRLELRHDRAADDLFFANTVATSDDATSIPNRAHQTTLTLGATTWF